MDQERALLKAQLASRHKVWRMVCGQPGYVVVCDLCGRLNPTDLHENIVTRGDSQGNAALQKIVLASPCNLHLLCNFCNTRLAMVVACSRWLLSLNLYRYGLPHITAWLERLPLAQPRGPYLNTVGEVYREMGAINYYVRWNEVNAVLLRHGVDAIPFTYQEVTAWQSRLSVAAP